MRVKAAAILAAFVILSSSQIRTAHAVIVDAINPLATPATPQVRVFYGLFDNIGWYYTPQASYTLTGIYGQFGPNDSSAGINHITVQIQTERPAKGGTLLAEGTFDGEQSVGGLLGTSLGPIELTAGQTYFIDYLHLSGMGVNLGTWDYDNMFVPQPSGGATTNLGVYYRDDQNGFDIETTNVWEVGGLGLARVSGAEPILFFEGIGVPEPNSGCLALLALSIGTIRYRLR